MSQSEWITADSYFVDAEYMNRVNFDAQWQAWQKAVSEHDARLAERPQWFPDRLWAKLPKTRQAEAQEIAALRAYEDAYAAEWNRANKKMDQDSRNAA